MKLNSTVALTLILLTLMLGASSVSALWGYTVGHEALKGITQPDARPTNKIKGRKGTSPQQAAVVMLKEEDVLASVKARIQGRGRNARPEKPKDEAKQNSKKESDQKAKLIGDTTSQAGFPISSQNQGVTLEVQSATYSGGTLLLKVNFKNQGEKAVRFLYSFLDVTDDQGRALSASTDGLPAELPPNGENFSGTVSIPTALLDDVKKLSLTLTDYPDQKLRLQIPEIPVKK